MNQWDVWVTQDGRVLAISDMDSDHIQNCIDFLHRQGFTGLNDLMFYVLGDSLPQGDMAQMAFDKEFADIAEKPINLYIDTLQAELSKRKAYSDR